MKLSESSIGRSSFGKGVFVLFCQHRLFRRPPSLWCSRCFFRFCCQLALPESRVQTPHVGDRDPLLSAACQARPAPAPANGSRWLRYRAAAAPAMHRIFRGSPALSVPLEFAHFSGAKRGRPFSTGWKCRVLCFSLRYRLTRATLIGPGAFLG